MKRPCLSSALSTLFRSKSPSGFSAPWTDRGSPSTFHRRSLYSLPCLSPQAGADRVNIRDHFNAHAGRFRLLLPSFPGMLALRASCFTSRLCLRCPFEGRLRLGLLITMFNVLLLSGFHPIIAGLNGVNQRFLFSVHCAGFQNLDLQIAAIETEKCLGLE